MSKNPKGRSVWRWVILVTVWSFMMTFSLSLVPGNFSGAENALPALLVLLLFILLGIFFDVLGIAAATVSEGPFRAMSSRRVRGAKQALWLIVRTDRVTSFCCDVVGDICGVAVGMACPAAALALWHTNPLATVIFSAAAAAMMVGGKALGKQIAMSKNVQIVLFAGQVLSILPFVKDSK